MSTPLRVVMLYVAFVTMAMHLSCRQAAQAPATGIADTLGATPEHVWRAALHECRGRREFEVCGKDEASPGCELIRMANASEFQIRLPVDELRRCLEPGAGLFLPVEALQ